MWAALTPVSLPVALRCARKSNYFKKASVHFKVCQCERPGPHHDKRIWQLALVST